MDKKTLPQFLLLNFHETTRHFSLGSQKSEYPRIFRVTGANQNARKLLSTDLVNTNKKYLEKGCVPGLHTYVPIESHSDRWFGGFVNR